MTAAQDWRRLGSFANQVVSLQDSAEASAGRVVEVIDLGGCGSRVQRPSSPKRLRDFTAWSFFTLGPAYVVCHIDRDVVAAMTEVAAAAGRKFEPDRLALRTDTRVVNIATNWAHTLEAVPAECLDELTSLVLGQRFRCRGDTVSYWGLRYADVAIIDPIAQHHRDWRDDELKPVIRVFYPVGTPYSMLVNPLLRDGDAIDFIITHPDDVICAEFAAMSAAIDGDAATAKQVIDNYRRMELERISSAARKSASTKGVR